MRGNGGLDSRGQCIKDESLRLLYVEIQSHFVRLQDRTTNGEEAGRLKSAVGAGGCALNSNCLSQGRLAIVYLVWQLVE